MSSAYQQEKCNFIAKHGEIAWRKKERAKKIAYRYRHPLKILLLDARKRAKRKNIEFAIDIENPGIEIPATCPVLGIPLFAKTDGRSGGGPNSPSIDRIDNSKGYVPGNIIVVSNRANSLKNDASLDELKRVVKFYGKLERTRSKSLPHTRLRTSTGKKRRTHIQSSISRTRHKSFYEYKNS